MKPKYVRLPTHRRLKMNEISMTKHGVYLSRLVFETLNSPKRLFLEYCEELKTLRLNPIGANGNDDAFSITKNEWNSTWVCIKPPFVYGRYFGRLRRVKAGVYYVFKGVPIYDEEQFEQCEPHKERVD